MAVRSQTIEPSLRVQAYLHRIQFSGRLDGSAEMLAEIQESHLHAVPYENFDILLGVPLSLEIDDLYRKIVENGRGGYCFELNALFRWLLEELGYPVTSLMARFWRDEPNPPPKRRHHVLRVEVDGRFYLCDVGVGGIVPRRPIEMLPHTPQTQGSETYKLEQEPFFGWILYEFVHESWRQLYSFTDEPQLGKDFTTTNYWCESSPDSLFTKGAMAALRTKEGRVTVSGNEFRVFAGDSVEVFKPKTPAAYHAALVRYFDINLPSMDWWHRCAAEKV